MTTLKTMFYPTDCCSVQFYGMVHIRKSVGLLWQRVRLGVTFSGQSRPEERISLRQTVTNSDIHQALLQLWSGVPIFDLPVSRDLPRLVRRIRVFDVENNVVFPHGCLEGADGCEQRTIDLVRSFVLTLAYKLESEDRFNEISSLIASMDLKGSDKVSCGGGATDLVVEDMLRTLSSEESSPTLRLIKTINQSFISHCAFHLKKNMTNLTKDVRGADGWLIDVVFTSDGVLIKHIRKEQSFEPVKNHWTLQWQILMEFNADVSAMTGATMKLLEVKFDQDVDPKVSASVLRDINLIAG